jgi:hypothetical protein
MLKTALPFPPTEQAQWIAQLHKELQHQTDLLHFKDPIEGLEIDLTCIPEALSIPPKSKDTWSNLFRYEIKEEKEANRILLAALMEGASALFLTCHKASCNWEKVLENIEVAYIDCWIQLNDVSNLQEESEYSAPKFMSLVCVMQMVKLMDAVGILFPHTLPEGIQPITSKKDFLEQFASAKMSAHIDCPNCKAFVSYRWYANDVKELKKHLASSLQDSKKVH